MLPASLSCNAGREGAGRPDDREEFQVELVAPGVVVGIGKGADPALPGIVDQNVQPAEGVDHPLLHRRDRRFVPDVADNRQHRVAEPFLQWHGGLGQPVFIAAAQGDLRPVFEQQPHRREADPGRAAGDQRPLAVEAEIHRAASVIESAKPASRRLKASGVSI